MNKAMYTAHLEVLASAFGRLGIGTDVAKKEHSDGRAKLAGEGRMKPLVTGYAIGPKGDLIRKYQKRDKSMSARQWKKKLKAARRSEKELHARRQHEFATGAKHF